MAAGATRDSDIRLKPIPAVPKSKSKSIAVNGGQCDRIDVCTYCRQLQLCHALTQRTAAYVLGRGIGIFSFSCEGWLWRTILVGKTNQVKRPCKNVSDMSVVALVTGGRAVHAYGSARLL